MITGVGIIVGREAVERPQVFKERLLKTRGVFLERALGGLYAGDDLILHVGHIHHMMNVVTPEPEITPEQIRGNECAKVSDMREVMNGRAAAVHAGLATRR